MWKIRVYVSGKGDYMSVEDDNPLELPTCDDKLLWDVTLSTYNLPTLIVAAELGLFPFIARKPATPEEVARTFSLNTEATEAFLGVLTSLGFLVQHYGRFYLTEVSQNFLLPESPYSWSRLLGSPPVITDMKAAVKEALQRKPTEEERAVKVFGMLKDADNVNWEQVRLMTQKSHVRSLPAAMGVARWGDFTGVRNLLDMGGGCGSFCIVLALKYPEIEFTVADLPAICEVAKECIAEYGLQDQIAVEPVDMFEDVWPSGYDAVFFSNIFHDWGEERSRYLGKKSFEVLPPGGRIYLHELLLADTKDSPPALTMYSLGLKFATRGKLFTAGELDNLLRSCGFKDISITNTYGYHSLITGRKL